jgi:hypothetical protein
MLLPEDKPDLLHYAYGYDPAKAHDYYMRVRQLHPRKKGIKPTPDVQAQRAEVAAAVTNLTNKLNELKQVLARKQAALNRDKKAKLSPAAAKTRKAQKSKQYRQTHKSQLRAKAKAAASKSHGGGRSHGGTSTQSVIADPKSGSIKEVQSAIKAVETALAAAKARQRALG